ncbi:DedD protein [Vibrio parahaemolyticus AQ3810]|nr:DedD protein [Vibrio parahaemolyticus AQ3810]
MASKFQSRLVGTIILVAVGVIVLPDVLDGKKLHYKEEFASIPIKPELDSDVENFEILEPVEDDIELPESPVEAVVQESERASG